MSESKYKHVLRILIIVLLNVCVIGLINIVMSPQAAVPALSKVGSRGSEVTAIQQSLKSLGYYTGGVDGIYGNGTAAAVRRFQADRGLSADGIAGPATLRALGITGDAAPGAAAFGGSLGGVYKQGSRGDGVRQIQQELKNRGFLMGNADGVFGRGTYDAARAFQRSQGLSADGIVGTATLRALGLGGSNGGKGESDYQLLARIISAESRNEPYLGQVAVGAVILNRVEHPSFPNSIAGVVYQPDAFTAVNDGQINQPIAESAYRAATEVFNGSDPSGGAIYYYNPKKTNHAWMMSRPVIKVIGNHRFCS